jgi:hypothetical protein
VNFALLIDDGSKVADVIDAVTRGDRCDRLRRALRGQSRERPEANRGIAASTAPSPHISPRHHESTWVGLAKATAKVKKVQNVLF